MAHISESEKTGLSVPRPSASHHVKKKTEEDIIVVNRQRRDTDATATTTFTDSVISPVTTNDPLIRGHDADLAYARTLLSAKEEAKLLRKIDLRLMVLCGFMYLIKQKDVENVANTRIMNRGSNENILEQLHMTHNDYNFVQVPYYIAYILFEVPSGVLFKKMTPSKFQSRIMVSWGITLACHAAVTNKQGLYVARLFLGLFEAGLYPGVLTHMCYWYRPDEMCKRLMIFGIIGNFSGVISGVLAFACSHLSGAAGLSGWQWLFLIEGLSTICFGVLVYFILPNFPPDTSWLTEKEKLFIQTRLPKDAPKAHEQNFVWSEVVSTLKDKKLWLFTTIWLLFTTGTSGVKFYQPSVIANLGFTDLASAQLLNLPVSFAAMIVLAITAPIVDRAYMPRPVFPMIYSTIIVSAYVVLFIYPSNTGVYLAIVFGMAFWGAWQNVMWPWRCETVSKATGAAFALAFVNSYGQIGNPLGPQIFREDFAPKYRQSFGIEMGLVAGCVVMICVTWWAVYDEEKETRRIKREKLKAEAEEKAMVREAER